MYPRATLTISFSYITENFKRKLHVRNVRVCSYTPFSKRSEAKNMEDFQLEWRHFHDYWSLW